MLGAQTGTLTTGVAEVSSCTPLDGRASRTYGLLDETRLLEVAAAVERGTQHPLGAAVVAAARDHGGTRLLGSDHQSFPGLGASAKVALTSSSEASHVHVGSQAFMKECGVPISEATAHEINKLNEAGRTCLLVAVESEVCVWLCVLAG